MFSLTEKEPLPFSNIGMDGSLFLVSAKVGLCQDLSDRFYEDQGVG